MNTISKLGILGTHAGNAESIIIATINSIRHYPITNVNDIGGLFDRENNAHIILDQKVKSGNYKASLHRDGHIYRVNLQNLMGVKWFTEILNLYALGTMEDPQ